MQVMAPVMMMFAILFPSKMWYGPNQPIDIEIKGAGGAITLLLTDFLGKPIDPQGSADVSGDKTVDITQVWQQLHTPGTYLLFAVAQGKPPAEFVGTPLVIGVREDERRDAPPGAMVIKVEPMRYGTISTEKGDMTIVFYYDLAPSSAANFMSLAGGGFYDGLPFHKIKPGFVIQSGDPRGDGTGGAGYQIAAEFNGREHREGVLSMSRQEDPAEAQGAMPRPEYANTASSQFFICLDYERTRQLDGRFTAFGRVVEGFDVALEIAKTPLDAATSRPTSPPMIRRIQISPVTSNKNPYGRFLTLSTVPLVAPTTNP